MSNIHSDQSFALPKSQSQLNIYGNQSNKNLGSNSQNKESRTPMMNYQSQANIHGGDKKILKNNDLGHKSALNTYYGTTRPVTNLQSTDKSINRLQKDGDNSQLFFLQ